jgi:hypothetical protein
MDYGEVGPSVGTDSARELAHQRPLLVGED